MARARTKRREELYVNLPSLFRCPISMEVMNSPVSLCTGVTYDRSSIERWLALGNNTCPATMQELPSTHTTPNLTLRRLIQLWVAQAELTQSSTISKQHAADVINGEMDAGSLATLIGFMKSSGENLHFVSSSDKALSRVVEVFGNKSDEVSICEAIVEIFYLLIASGNGIREKLSSLILKNGDGNLNRCLSTFVTILRKGNLESKVRAAKILASIATNHASQCTIAEKEGLLYELHNLSTAEKNQASAIEAGLSALSTISTSRPAQKELIGLGIVRTAARILSSNHDDRTPPVITVIEKASTILQSIATCAEGRNTIIGDTECVTEIVKTLMKCSATATEQGVTVLWSVCCLSRDCASIERVINDNGLTKVLLVMQSDCSASTRQMCAELVKVLRAKTTRSSLSTYETRTAHIMPY